MVATLESGPERAALDLAKSRALMQGELKSAEARVELTQKNYKSAPKSFTSKTSYRSTPGTRPKPTTACPSNSCARPGRTRNSRNWKCSASCRGAGGLRTIRSPLSGIVVEVMLKPGEFSSSNLKEPILKLAEVDPLHVEVILAGERCTARSRPGQHAAGFPRAAGRRHLRRHRKGGRSA